MQPDYDDHKAFEPHAYVNQDGNDEDDDQIVADTADPEQLRDQDVTGHHRNPGPLIGTERAIHEMKAFVGVAAIPGDEKLHCVGVADD